LCELLVFSDIFSENGEIRAMIAAFKVVRIGNVTVGRGFELCGVGERALVYTGFYLE